MDEYKNMTSEEGVEKRLNRSIQAKEMFSEIKEDLENDRFRQRGLSGILCDINC